MKNPNEIFFNFLERKDGSPKVITAPIFGTFFCTGWNGKEWIPPLLNETVVEDLLSCGQAAGVIPIICIGWWDLNPFGWETEEISSDENHHSYALVLRGKSGTLRQIYEDRPRLGSIVKHHPIRNTEDYKIVLETFDNLKENEDRVRNEITKIIRQAGNRGVLYLNVPMPHLVFGLIDDQQLIYDLADYPERLTEIFDECAKAAFKLVDIGLEAGIRIFFCGTHGILGPNLIKQYAVPYAVKLREKLHAHNSFLYLHECGKMKAMIETGIYNEICPDILEGFDHPPVGDVDDLSWARARLDPKIIFKGNLRLEDLKNGPPQRIRQLCQETITAVKGHPHILGTSCSILYGTPIQHVQAMADQAPLCHSREGGNPDFG